MIRSSSARKKSRREEQSSDCSLPWIWHPRCQWQAGEAMKVEEEKAGLGALNPAHYRRPCQDQEGCCSVHLVPVSSYPQRKRDQKGCPPGLRNVRWGLRPEQAQPEPPGPERRARTARPTVQPWLKMRYLQKFSTS
nr:electrogenic sodium bicarbonate cotransporter 4-like [Dasypus novemcinctus]